MKKRNLLILLFLLLGLNLASQNLVQNPSFEGHSTCTIVWSQSTIATGWNTNINTADYYNACFDIPPPVNTSFSVPYNVAGYQCASTGNAYCGLYCYLEINPGSQEFVGTKLSVPLTTGEFYYVSFKTNLTQYSTCAIDRLGVLFTTYTYGDTVIIPAPVINNFAHIYSSDFITDSIIWTTVSGSFIADSAYEYLMIGNFYDNINTNLVIYDSTNIWCYYYIDDICVSIDSLTCVDITNEIIDFNADTTAIFVDSCINFSINTVVDYDFYNWQFEGGTPSVSTDSTPTNICYDTAGNYDVILIASDSSGCGDTIIKNNYIVVESGTGTYEDDLRSNVSIYPNPVQNILYIQPQVNKPLDINVYNVLGQSIYNTMLNPVNRNDLISIDFSEVPAGVYMVNIAGGDETLNKKVVVVR